MRVFLILIAMTLCGCATISDGWSEKEKAAFAFSVAGNAADLYTSMRTGPDCYETNPILGKNPSDLELVAVKLIGLAAEAWIYTHFDTGTHWYGIVNGTVNFGLAYSNTRNDCYP